MLALSASDVEKLWRRIKNESMNSVNHAFIERVVGVVAPASTCLRSCWRQTFRAYDVKTMWLTTRSMIFETITDSGFVAIQWFIKMYMYKYCVNSSICHFKFSKVVLAHVIGEVGTFCTVLLAGSSRTCVPICIVIDSYWPTQSKSKLAQFLRRGVCRSPLV